MIPKELQHMKQLQPGERLGQNRESEYLGAEDIDPGTEPVVTIAAIYSGMVTLQRGKEMKDVIAFKEDSVPGIRNVRPLIVNATNRKTLRKLFGSVKVEALTGQAIQLYIDNNVRDPSSGDRIDGIRIRPRKPSVRKEAPLVCSDCGKPIVAVGNIAADVVAKLTFKKYGSQLCSDCGNKRKTAMEAEAAKVADKPANVADSTADKKEG